MTRNIDRLIYLAAALVIGCAFVSIADAGPFRRRCSPRRLVSPLSERDLLREPVQPPRKPPCPNPQEQGVNRNTSCPGACCEQISKRLEVCCGRCGDKCSCSECGPRKCPDCDHCRSRDERIGELEKELAAASEERDRAVAKAAMGEWLMWAGSVVAMVVGWLLCVVYRPKQPRVGSWCVLLVLLCSNAAYGQGIVTRSVEVGSGVTRSDFRAGWWTLGEVRQVDSTRLGKVLADIESRMPANHEYRDADVITWGHETTHGINSRCRVEIGGNVNAFYCLNGRVGVFREPAIRKSRVAAYVPAHLRGDVFGLYMTGQSDWDDRPLYVIDEWVAYINGLAVGLEYAGNQRSLNGRSIEGDARHVVEFCGYASALLRTIDAECQGYPDREPLREFVGYNIKRSLDLASRHAQGHAQQFAVAYWAGGWGNCQSCQGGNCPPSWNQGYWSQSSPPPAPVQNVVKQPPMTPVQPKPQVVNGAPGKNGVDGKPGRDGVDGNPGRDAPDLDTIVAAVLKKLPEAKQQKIDIKALSVEIAALLPKHEPTTTDQIKQALAGVKLPVRIIRPNGQHQDFLWPADGRSRLDIQLLHK